MSNVKTTTTQTADSIARRRLAGEGKQTSAVKATEASRTKPSTTCK